MLYAPGCVRVPARLVRTFSEAARFSPLIGLASDYSRFHETSMSRETTDRNSNTSSHFSSIDAVKAQRHAGTYLRCAGGSGRRVINHFSNHLIHTLLQFPFFHCFLVSLSHCLLVHLLLESCLSTHSFFCWQIALRSLQHKSHSSDLCDTSSLTTVSTSDLILSQTTNPSTRCLSQATVPCPSASSSCWCGLCKLLP